MVFTIALAGVPIEIHSVHDAVYTMCREYLTEEAPAFVVAITQEDIDFERQKSIDEAKYERRPAFNFPDDYLETLAVYRKIATKILDYDALLMHGAVVALDGKAYLFTAPSGVGKTTHTGFWLDTYPEAYILNGDKPLLRLINGRVFACGTPWAGKEGMNRNEMLSLFAIVALLRGKENAIEPISLDAILPLLIQQTYRPSDAVALQKTLALISELGKRVRFYKLACNLDPDAARVAKEGMDRS